MENQEDKISSYLKYHNKSALKRINKNKNWRISTFEIRWEMDWFELYYCQVVCPAYGTCNKGF